MFRHLLLTQADVPDFWTRWIVNGFGLGNPSPLFYGHPRVEVGRINAHPPRMNNTAQLQKHRSLIKRLFPSKLQITPLQILPHSVVPRDAFVGIYGSHSFHTAAESILLEAVCFSWNRMSTK